MTDTCKPALDQAAAMTVVVPDEVAAKATGRPIICEVTIAATCPGCGGPRGEATRHSRTVDGVRYSVDQWANKCGHTDYYTAVLAEARAAKAR